MEGGGGGETFIYVFEGLFPHLWKKVREQFFT